MSKLYIDVGNTNAKFKYDSNKNLFFFLPTSKCLDEDALLIFLEERFTDVEITSVIFSSVVTNVNKAIFNVFKKHFKLDVKEISHSWNRRVELGTDHPERVGEDLIALSEFAANKSNNSIVVNMGTATTIIHVKDKALQGVVISLGLSKVIESAFTSFSAIPNYELEYVNSSIGTNTKEALSIGIVNGHLEMIKGLVKNIDENAHVYISGGASNKIKDFSEFIFVEEATIAGLEVIASLNNL